MYVLSHANRRALHGEHSSPYYSKKPTRVYLNKFEGLMSSSNKKQVKADVSNFYRVN